MSNTSFLQEMQIDQWQVLHPERLEGVDITPISLPEHCRMLLISPNVPTSAERSFLAKVLGSFKVSIDDAFLLEPQQLSQVDITNVEWVWFCQCEPSELESVKTLHSESLSLVESNKEHKQALWKQIKSYE